MAMDALDAAMYAARAASAGLLPLHAETQVKAMKTMFDDHVEGAEQC